MMTTIYDYLEYVTASVRDWFEERRELIDSILESLKPEYDDIGYFLAEMMTRIKEDHNDITGEEQDSYTCSYWDAERNLYGNRELLAEALDEFYGYGDNLAKVIYILRDPELCDVAIRKYLLPEAIENVVTEIWEKHSSEK